MDSYVYQQRIVVLLNMTKTRKIWLTIPPILTFSYTFTFWFPTEFHWLVPSMKVYYLQVGTLQALTMAQLIILIRKLWSFKNIDKSKKTDWTWLLLLFTTVTSLIFIWKKADEFEKLNNSEKPMID